MKRFAAAAATASLAALAVAPSSSAGESARSEATELPSSIGAKRSATPPAEPPLACPAGMVEVEGEWCPIVEQYCSRPMDPKHKERDRCAEFAPTGRCLAPIAARHFCIDRYEWPNQPGVKPVVAVEWNEAKATCEGAGKRLCGDSEWTLACEGREHLPYPYGYARNAEACNIDRPYIVPNDEAWRDLKKRPAEIARLDQRDPSGARESCVSPYGVFDMTGNVDEWVNNEKGHEKEKPFVSGLKGGYWGPVRDRCRPMTTDHNQWHSGYQIGFRCCSDVASKASSAAEAQPAASGS